MSGSTEAAASRLDARSKLICCCGFVLITVSTPPGDVRLLAGLAAGLLLAVVVARVQPALLARRLLHLAPFFLVAAAGPLLHQGISTEQAIGMVIKAGLGCCALVLLAATTPVDELLAGLARLGCPRLMVLLLGLTVRYLHVLGEEARRLRRAAVARGFAPRHLLQARVVGDLVGALFLRSHARAERVHAAMLARGFHGDLVLAPPARLRMGDILIPAVALGGTLAWRVYG
jgi:cobalt/nickel transport system permease protein